MIKRLFDIIASLLGIIILSPVFLVVALKVRKNLGIPVFFKQVRPGKDGKPFTMIKFRSMRDAYDKEGNPLSDAERLTPFGKKLRSTSLDELPELWNVLKGEMSLVGPRPLLMKYLPLYNDRQALRNSVKPGITGWAQINGRNAISWEDKFELDAWYVENQSFWLDIKIILLTIKTIFTRKGISSEGHETAPEFRGTETNSKEKE